MLCLLFLHTGLKKRFYQCNLNNLATKKHLSLNIFLESSLTTHNTLFDIFHPFIYLFFCSSIRRLNSFIHFSIIYCYITYDIHLLIHSCSIMFAFILLLDNNPFIHFMFSVSPYPRCVFFSNNFVYS